MPIRRDTPNGRFYTLDAISPLTGTVDFPSVTHILSCLAKPALINWAANLERELVMTASADLYEDAAALRTPLSRDAYLTTLHTRLGQVKAHRRSNDKAKEIGSQAHKAIEVALRRALGQTVPEPRIGNEALWAYMAFDDWARAHAVRPVAIEQAVWSTLHGYAGTMDLLAHVDGELALVDFKTSKAIYEESFLQNVAYQVAIAEMGHGLPTKGYILRLPKNTDDPAFEVAEVPPLVELFPTFLAICQTWRWWWQAEQRSRAAWEAKRAGAAA